MGLVIGVFLRFRLAFATRPYRKFTDDHRALDAVLRRLVVGADAIKSATRSYTSPGDMTRLWSALPLGTLPRNTLPGSDQTSTPPFLTRRLEAVRCALR